MKLFVASDHAGEKLKKKLLSALIKSNQDFEDLSPVNTFDDDYPVFAEKVAKKVVKSKNKGVLICGTGIGMSIAANKIKGVRGALCSDEKDAELARRHNDANILVLSSSTSTNNLLNIINKFKNTSFEKGRHLRRINKIKKLEK
jgi:RpiB/LacA/LacB family sugar-phosphate isomerase